MRLLVSGGRHFANESAIERSLDAVHRDHSVSVLIHGGLTGIGPACEGWARRNDVHLIRYPANWSMGKCGDFIRDDFMLSDCRADLLLVFPGGRRTTDMVREAQRMNLRVIVANAAGEDPGAGTSDRPTFHAVKLRTAGCGTGMAARATG